MLQRRHIALVVTTLLALPLAGCAANELGDLPSDLKGTLDGSGSSAQGSAQEVWISAFQHNNAAVTINYDPSGSGAGREAFLAGGSDFAGSDSALNDDELAGAFLSCAPGTQAIDLPLYISPLAVVFNIDGVTELNLDPSTLAAIFKGDITEWDDARITELNPDAGLPAAPITAVHRSDDSGTTKNFLDYLHQTSPEIWDVPPGDAFPYPTGESAQGNSGVVSAVTNGLNTIGYADASKAGDLGIASLGVGDDFVQPTADAAAAIAEISPRVEGRSEFDLAIAVDRTSEQPGVYPLVLISYIIVCQTYADPDVASLVKEYVSFVASAEGQALAASSAGSAPISATLFEEVQRAIEAIS